MKWMGISTAALSGIAMLALAVFALSLPAESKAYLYWYSAGRVVRASLDGHRVDYDFIPRPTLSRSANERVGIALSNRYIYLGPANETVGRADLNGDELDSAFVRILAPGQIIPSIIDQTPLGSITIGNSHIYWPGIKGIGRASIDGGHVQLRFITNIHVQFVATYDGYIYWAAQHTIGRARLNGTEIQPSLLHLDREEEPISGFTVADGHIYWCTAHGRSLSRANMQGGEVDADFINGLRFTTFCGIAATGENIYWENGKTIGRANIDGSEMRRDLITPTSYILGAIAADALGPDAYAPSIRKPKPTQAPSRPRSSSASTNVLTAWPPLKRIILG